MTKILATLVIVLTAALLTPQTLRADQYGQGAYGQGVVLGKGGAVEIEHEPKETGIRENIGLIGIGFLATSTGFLYLSKKEKAKSLLIS
jgi:hypothetical protein